MDHPARRALQCASGAGIVGAIRQLWSRGKPAWQVLHVALLGEFGRGNLKDVADVNPLARGRKTISFVRFLRRPYYCAGAWSGVACCFLDELHARGQPEFCIDVGEVGLYGAR